MIYRKIGHVEAGMEIKKINRLGSSGLWCKVNTMHARK